MNLHELNTLDKQKLREELFKCCGSSAWVEKMVKVFPMDDLVELLEDAEEKWFECSEADWQEAFTHHPEIGDIESLRKKFNNSGWAAGEQAGVKEASQPILEALAEGNQLYKARFGYIFIVHATGKSAEEMLGLLHARLPNAPGEEIKIAADEQNKITKARLEKLLED
jgi:2-oxo-4-hydroxy-4-carboxy-5-ureidoimidazoline decarboxylase